MSEKAVYENIMLLVEEMDAKQRTDSMVEYMRDLLIAVNKATPMQVARVMSTLARAAQTCDNPSAAGGAKGADLADIFTQGENDDDGSVGGRWT